MVLSIILYVMNYFSMANCARDGVQMVCSLLVKLVVLNVVGKNDGGMKMNVM